MTTSVLSRQSLVKTVSFVEDRFRAVQVDLVRSQQTSADLQLILIRAQILILYLTLDNMDLTVIETSLYTLANKPIVHHSSICCLIAVGKSFGFLIGSHDAAVAALGSCLAAFASAAD